MENPKNLKVAQDGMPNHNYLIDENGKWIAKIQTNGELTHAQDLAFVKLVSSAPELLEALEKVLSLELLLIYPEKPYMSESMIDEAQEIDNMIKNVKNAIKKAIE